MHPRSVITIGNFDGVHRGHAALVARARELARPVGARVVVLAFDPHPLSLLKPGAEPAKLMEFSRRRELLAGLGADEVVHLTPSPGLLSQTAEEFIASMVDRYRPVAIVEGADFRFGRNRGGDVVMLAELGRARGFSVEVVPAVEVALSDHTLCRASSTMVRWLVSRGRVGDAARVLGRPYELVGTVVRGDRRGRELGFPTANVETHQPLPADGVYAAWAELPGVGGGLGEGPRLPAALSVGMKPTFSGVRRTVEAHVLRGGGGGAGGAWSPLVGSGEYDWAIRLGVVSWVRDQVRFGSREALVDQLDRDCRVVVERLGDGARVWEGAQA